MSANNHNINPRHSRQSMNCSLLNAGHEFIEYRNDILSNLQCNNVYLTSDSSFNGKIYLPRGDAAAAPVYALENEDDDEEEDDDDDEEENHKQNERQDNPRHRIDINDYDDIERDDLQPGMSHTFSHHRSHQLDTMNMSDSTSFFESLEVDKEKIEQSLSLGGMFFILVSLVIFTLDTGCNTLLTFLLFKQKSHWFTCTLTIILLSSFICNLASFSW